MSSSELKQCKTEDSRSSHEDHGYLHTYQMVVKFMLRIRKL